MVFIPELWVQKCELELVKLNTVAHQNSCRAFVIMSPYISLIIMIIVRMVLCTDDNGENNDKKMSDTGNDVLRYEDDGCAHWNSSPQPVIMSPPPSLGLRLQPTTVIEYIAVPANSSNLTFGFNYRDELG